MVESQIEPLGNASRAMRAGNREVWNNQQTYFRFSEDTRLRLTPSRIAHQVELIGTDQVNQALYAPSSLIARTGQSCQAWSQAADSSGESGCLYTTA